MSLFDISKLKIELSDLENQTIEENFWNDPKNSSNVLNKIKQLKTKCTDFSKIQNEIENSQELIELLKMEPDEEIIRDLLKNTNIDEEQEEELRKQKNEETLLSGDRQKKTFESERV